MAKGNRTHKEASALAKQVLHAVVAGGTGKTKTLEIETSKELSPFYTRPLYYGTSIQNDTIAELHKDDYKYTKAKCE